MLDEMLGDPDAQSALTMLDCNDLDYEITPGRTESLNKEDYLRALRVTNQTFSEKEAYVRKCFDALFYYMAMLEHYVKSELVRMEDVTFPLDYFLDKIEPNKQVFLEFLNFYQQHRTIAFMSRLGAARSRRAD
jgi:hypothetical protein